jgi:hypothetical protein
MENRQMSCQKVYRAYALGLIVAAACGIWGAPSSMGDDPEDCYEYAQTTCCQVAGLGISAIQCPPKGAQRNCPNEIVSDSIAYIVFLWDGDPFENAYYLPMESVSLPCLYKPAVCMKNEQGSWECAVLDEHITGYCHTYPLPAEPDCNDAP